MIKSCCHPEQSRGISNQEAPDLIFFDYVHLPVAEFTSLRMTNKKNS